LAAGIALPWIFHPVAAQACYRRAGGAAAAVAGARAATAAAGVSAALARLERPAVRRADLHALGPARTVARDLLVRGAGVAAAAVPAAAARRKDDERRAEKDAGPSEREQGGLLKHRSTSSSNKGDSGPGH